MSEKKITKIQEDFKLTCKDKLRITAMLLIFLSLIFFITMLIGGSTGSVFLSEFTFDEGISKLLNTKTIKFTMLGYCIDDRCTKDVSHDYDKAPTSSEIKSGEINKRSIDNINDHKYVVRDFNPGDVIGDTKDKIGDVADEAGNKVKDVNVGETVDNIGEKAGEIGQKVGELADQVAKEALELLLKAFDNFRPKEPTGGIAGWISKPIIAAIVFNFVALLLLFFVNQDNSNLFYPLTIILLLVSIVLNLASLITTSMLFSLVFNIIGAFPGIGDNKTGTANGLSICSLLCLIIALMITMARACSNLGKGNNTIKNEPNESNV